MKELGNAKYENILNNLNFDCTYRNLQKLPLPIKFTHHLQDILNRLDNDVTFRQRLCNNFIVKICYQLINLLRIKKLLIYVFPKFLCPYLIMEIRKKYPDIPIYILVWHLVGSGPARDNIQKLIEMISDITIIASDSTPNAITLVKLFSENIELFSMINSE